MQQETCEKLEGEAADQLAKYNAVASELARTENAVHDLETEKSELLYRLALADEECKALAAWAGQMEAKYNSATQKLHEYDEMLEEKSSVHQRQQAQLKDVATSHERDAIQSQLARERDEWKQNEAHRAALETRRVEQFRSMDLELRQHRQSLSRVRIEWESEKSNRGKAESALLKATEMSDAETKSSVSYCLRRSRLLTLSLQADVQHLALEVDGSSRKLMLAT
ncbi:hypothetical protein FI667_g12290, partial [Globisporangium splendens]